MPASQPSTIRHRVVAATFVLAAILYLDRAALGILAPAIRSDLHLGPMAMGWIFSAFVWGYALFHIPSGWLGDRFGARRVLTAIVLLWSGFTAATSFAWNEASMLAIRFLFGAAEAGATPNVSQSFARWIPFPERARAQGFYFSGMSAGAAIAPPLATVFLRHWGWRVSFLIFGALGTVWAGAWYAWYRDRPEEHPRVDDRELAMIAEKSADGRKVPIAWRRLLRQPNLWAILFMYFTYGYTGYIYITWFPTYLIEGRHLSVTATGFLASVPSILGLVAKPLGGWWSDRLTMRHGLVFGRRAVGIFGFGLGAIAVLPGLFIANPWAAVGFLSVADAGAALAHGVCFAVCLDTGVRRAGTFAALMLTMGSLGNALSAIAFGGSLQFANSWAPPFLLAMAANLAGALLWLRIDPRQQMI